jgi:hypothetical protein
MHIRAEGKYRKAVAGGRPQFPSKLRQAASGSGELEAKRSICLPGMQRGSRKGFTSQRQYDRCLVGRLSLREHPVAIRLGGRSGYRIRGLGALVMIVGAMVRSISGDQPFNSRSGR